MVYRNDDPNDHPHEPGRGEPDPEESDTGEPGPDDSEAQFGFALESDDSDDGPYDYLENPGPSAYDIARSERDAIAGEDAGGFNIQMLKTGGAVLLIFAALGLLISLVGPLAFSRDSGPENNVYQAATVRQVVDGNTIVVEIDGQTETVRYIGISVGVQGDAFHRSSRLANQSWVDGQVVILERDVRDRDTDGRLLRYVYVNNQMMNAILVNSGLARYFPDGSNIRYNRELLAAESAARDGKRGLWTDRDLANDRPA